MSTRPFSIFEYEKSEIIDQETGRIKFHQVKLAVSFFPYKRGTKFDNIEIDLLSQKFIAERKGKRLAHNLIFSLSTTYSPLPNAKPTN